MFKMSTSAVTSAASAATGAVAGAVGGAAGAAAPLAGTMSGAGTVAPGTRYDTVTARFDMLHSQLGTLLENAQYLLADSSSSAVTMAPQQERENGRQTCNFFTFSDFSSLGTVSIRNFFPSRKGFN